MTGSIDWRQNHESGGAKTFVFSAEPDTTNMLESSVDRFIGRFDVALRTLAGVHRTQRPSPAVDVAEAALEGPERAHAAALMRVNHVGEVCAQALYQGQALIAREPRNRQALEQAGLEEQDHLAWSAQRIGELGGRTSLLNPLWYAGALAMGAVAGALGDRWNLAFLAETERQVEEHLGGHLERAGRGRAARAGQAGDAGIGESDDDGGVPGLGGTRGTPPGKLYEAWRDGIRTLSRLCDPLPKVTGSPDPNDDFLLAVRRGISRARASGYERRSGSRGADVENRSCRRAGAIALVRGEQRPKLMQAPLCASTSTNAMLDLFMACIFPVDPAA